MGGCWKGETSCESWAGPIGASSLDSNSETLNSYICDSCLDSAFARSGFSVTRIDSLPDEVLYVPLPRAISAVNRNTPLQLLEAARFQSSIHIGPGVSIPKEIEHDLSVGIKYMFHQPRRVALIHDAWNDFERRLRWRLKFMFEGENKTYDPDYDVRPPSKADPPVLPYYCELAIRKGSEFVLNSTSKIPEDRKSVV